MQNKRALVGPNMGDFMIDWLIDWLFDLIIIHDWFILLSNMHRIIPKLCSNPLYW